ncbi:pyridoxal 5'-phosphate synthase glutaminase subunit PdxT [Acidiferrimicrobium sp. IK]|uniref:pyridoxal 5'-phosphate synthase glutaminase subunit PdxT n=1 Tax=Acidiferrimicrobium sp. IK TaxID=2871700 RepID=UPI0021CB311F|nr:pyridoxal 5'-phosphate synthase glutaminase subunit PdxT [Acidiferrimicrobium sp. IK]MCU4184861.1 pyridoxal 5'-phosphate synthase glutaminase subunit PdxT [Acidiferrimicrobium sp. IK]
MNAPTIGVLALQGDVREHIRVIGDLGARALEVRRAADLAQVDGLIIPGGESTAISVLLGSSDVLEPLRRRLAEGMPTLGTCAGMILLAAEVIDGRPDQERLAALDITVRRNAFGRQVDSFETDLDIAGLDGPPLHAVFIRAPLVERVGPGVEVLARVAGRDGAARPVVCRQGPVLVAAFHPELAGDTRLHQLFLDVVAQAGDAETGPVSAASAPHQQ